MIKTDLGEVEIIVEELKMAKAIAHASQYCRREETKGKCHLTIKGAYFRRCGWGCVGWCFICNDPNLVPNKF